MNELPNFDYVVKRDYHTAPFRRVVVLGESHVANGAWVRTFASLLSEFQGDPPPEVINAGIGGNVISPRSPGYCASQRPSALERYQTDVISHDPDLVVLSYGLNDMRAGMPLAAFIEDMTHIIEEIQRKTDAIIVLTTVYNMSAYALYPPFDKGSIEAAETFNTAIRELAEKHDALTADIWAAEGCAPWIMRPDTVHANRLGHTLIGHCVFQTVAIHCSGVAHSLKVPPEESERTLRRKRHEALERIVIRKANLPTARNLDGKVDELW